MMEAMKIEDAFDFDKEHDLVDAKESASMMQNVGTPDASIKPGLIKSSSNDERVHNAIHQISNKATSPWDPEDDELDSSVYTDLNQTSNSVPNPWDPNDNEFDDTVYADISNAKTSFTSCDILEDNVVGQARTPPVHNTARSKINTLIQSYRVLGCDDFNAYNTIRSLDNNDIIEEETADDRLRREENLRDMIAELEDRSAMSPVGIDQHDRIISSFYVDAVEGLPCGTHPHKMHLLDWRQLSDPFDDLSVILKEVKPRMGDAVATVLHESSPKVLEAFLDKGNKVVEWWTLAPSTSQIPSTVIRRDGNQVIVATFRSMGFCLRWSYYAKCEINEDGTWAHVFGFSGSATSSIHKGEVVWDSFERLNPNDHDIEELLDPLNALVEARSLGKWLLTARVWATWENRTSSEWVCDGKRMELTGRGEKAQTKSGCY